MSIVRLAQVDIEVDIFQLHTDPDEPLEAVDVSMSDRGDTLAPDREDVTSHAKITRLPNKSLQGIWES